MSVTNNMSFEYIVVGSGAGGGTVAARLAEQGRKVLVLEAGGIRSSCAAETPLIPMMKTGFRTIIRSRCFTPARLKMKPWPGIFGFVISPMMNCRKKT